MQRTLLTVLVASLVVISAVGGASAVSFAGTGVDPETGLGGLAQETSGSLLGGDQLPEEVATFGGQPGWHVAVNDRAALEDWANSSDSREILSYDNNSNNAVIRAASSDIGTGFVARLLGTGLHARSYVQSIAVVQTIDAPEPPDPVSREQFEAPETGLFDGLGTGLPLFGGSTFGTAGIAFTEDANESTLGEARDTINADVAGNGSGVEIAILDDGVTYDESLYGDRVTAARDFVGDRPGRAANGWQNVSSASGHGSWVASAIAANASNHSFDGIAPSTQLAIGKVLSNSGGTSADIVDGLNWACNEQQADIVSMSLGSQVYSAPIDAAVQNCVDNGTLVVVAAGNSAGTIPVGIASPADSIGEDAQRDGIITVAATNVTANASDAGVAHFSQRGPDPGSPSTTYEATRGANPTIAAPGMEITARTADGSSTLSGTSMATPLVSGSAALLLDADPDANVTQIEQRLAQGATPINSSGVHEVGAGMVDVQAAMTAEVNETDYYTDQREARTDAAVARDETYAALAGQALGWFSDDEEAFGA